MRRFMSFILAAVLLLSLYGCDDKEHQAELDALNAELEVYSRYSELITALEAKDYGAAADMIEAFRVQGHHSAVSDGTLVEITVTAENWSDYFEIREITQWQENDMKQAVGFMTHVCLVLKDAYAEKVISDKSRVDFAWQSLCSVKNCDIDLDNRIINKENVFQSKVTTFGAPEILSGTVSYAGEPVQQSWSGDTYVAAEIGEVVIVGEYMLNGAKKSVFFDYEDTQITDAQGILTLTGEEAIHEN